MLCVVCCVLWCVSGHGTYVSGEELVASLAGVVERVNKLVSVRPVRSRYTAEVGDVVVGRVKEVGSRRWKIDINARQDAVLMLSSINLSGGVQRRRTVEDQLQMRSFFAENDLISADVHSFYADGAIALHARSLKYGKVRSTPDVCLYLCACMPVCRCAGVPVCRADDTFVDGTYRVVVVVVVVVFLSSTTGCL